MLRMIGSMIFVFSMMFAMAGVCVAPVIVMATDAQAVEKPVPLWVQVQEVEKSLAKCVEALGQVEAQFGECSRSFGEVSSSLEICEGNLNGQAAAVALMSREIEKLRDEKKSLQTEIDRLQKELGKVGSKKR